MYAAGLLPVSKIFDAKDLSVFFRFLSWTNSGILWIKQLIPDICIMSCNILLTAHNFPLSQVPLSHKWCLGRKYFASFKIPNLNKLIQWWGLKVCVLFTCHSFFSGLFLRENLHYTYTQFELYNLLQDQLLQPWLHAFCLGTKSSDSQAIGSLSCQYSQFQLNSQLFVTIYISHLDYSHQILQMEATGYLHVFWGIQVRIFIVTVRLLFIILQSLVRFA